MRQQERGAVKLCSKCKVEQPIERFHLKAVWCKSCVHEYDKAIYQRKRPEVLARKKLYRKVNHDKVRAANRKWMLEHADQVRDYLRVYKKTYYLVPEARAARNLDAATRRLAQKNATPPWADKKAMRDIYLRAQRLSEQTGQEHVVDHIVPLLGRKVCGLHTEHNLQILLAIENSRKNNKLIDDVV